MRLIGDRLKVAGRDSGLFLCPADGDGNISKDGTDWTEVDLKQFSCNKMRRVEFFIPDNLSAGSYRIMLRTSFARNGVDRKTAISTESQPITIRNAS